jgi:epothilone polyketide synthase D
MADELERHAPELARLRWVGTDALDPGLESTWKPPATNPDDLAFLQYTSGSTGDPKGVMVTHANLLRNCELMQEAFGLRAEMIGVSWLPPYHDMGLIGGLLVPLFVSCPSVWMPPVAFLQKPLRWLATISRYNGHFSAGPNFAYELCTRKITAAQKEGLDLSHWKVAVSGAEPVQPGTLQRFAAAFADCGFRPEAFSPCYGLAESTLLVSAGTLDEAPSIEYCDSQQLALQRVVPCAPEAAFARGLVSCGSPVGDQDVAIVNADTRERLAPGYVGEIWVRGGSVAKGYWRKAKASAQAFGAHIVGEAGGAWMRTGDLGFLSGGDLFIGARIKDQIILRGKNHYPQDLELSADHSHPAMRSGCGAAFSIELGEEERLVVVQELDRDYLKARRAETRRSAAANAEGESSGTRDIPMEFGEVGRTVQQRLVEEHEVQLYELLLIRPGTILKTSSGKIQRRACRERYLQGGFDVIGRWSSATREPDSVAPRGRAEPAPGPSALRGEAADIEGWLVNRLAAQVGCQTRSIDPEQPFASYGLDSAGAAALTGDLAEWLGRPMPVTLAWDFPTPARLARHLAGEDPMGMGSDPSGADGTRSGLAEPIAIVGMSCRFPGADSLGAFWDLLARGGDGVTDVPADRWQMDDLYDPEPGAPGKVNTRRGGFLENVDQFDPEFFGISAREAASMDPQQRLLLEVSWEALEDAGLVPGRLRGSRTGVFVGITGSDYGHTTLYSNDRSAIDAYAGTGSALSIAAGRLSYVLGFEGPSLALDTACSSSLVAVHQACQSLRLHEADRALAGGVNLILSPQTSIFLNRTGALSPDGRCQPFSAAANGYVRSEGCAVVVLRRLCDAVAAGERILAVVRGSAINHDGQTNGLTAPSGSAQQGVIRAALARAHVEPAQVSFVESHGTGTSLGDPIEMSALGAVLGRGQRELLVGAVKSNIGHAEAAAGVAGLVKVVLSLGHEAIPPNLHFTRPSPHIAWEDLRVRVPTARVAWPRTETPRIAGVSSFGFSGTNAHIIVEEAPSVQEAEAAEGLPASILVVSGKTESALSAQASRYADWLAACKEPVADVCYTAANAREHFPHRLAIVSGTKAGLREGLQRFVAGESRPGCAVGNSSAGRSKLAFLFTGQGAQYVGMGRQLYETQPVFRDVLSRCDALLRGELERPLLSVLFGDSFSGEALAGAPGRASDLDETAYTQPCLFALEYALAELWRCWGVEPEMVLGHSVGEYVAACVAGVFSLEDGVKLISARGRLMQGLARDAGTMAAVAASQEQVSRVLQGYAGSVVIATVNGPASVVISGERGAVELACAELNAAGARSKPLSVSHAFHSALMEPILDEFEAVAQRVEFALPRIPLVSNLTGALAGEELLEASYWRRHLREPVLFSAGMQTLQADGCDVYLELGPQPTLLSLGQRCGLAGPACWLPSLRRGHDDWQVILESLGQFHVRGVPIDWAGFDAPYARRLTSLPTYAWQRESYWIDRQAPVPGAKTGPDLLAVEWRPAPLEAQPERPGSVGNWLLLAERDDDLADRLEARLVEGDARRVVRMVPAGETRRMDDGRYAVDVTSGRGLAGLLAGEVGLDNELEGVIYLGPVPAGEAVAISAQERLLSGCMPGVYLSQALAALPQRTAPRLWFVTRNAQQVGAGDPVSVWQAPLWGLGATIAHEHPEYRCSCADIHSDQEISTQVETLVDELLADAIEDRVALRPAGRYVARLVKTDWPGGIGINRIRSDGSYLITGGLGGLGRSLATWLVAQGARSLVLMSRSGARENEQKATVRELEAVGVRVDIVAADVADPSSLQAALEPVRKRGALRGVFHLAAVLDDKILREQDREGFERVLSPKACGAWNLHELTREDPLDVFVTYSSAASLLGSPGQSNYAAANAFVDALARQRRSEGRVALSINWGPFSEVGLAASADRNSGLARWGIASLTPADAHAILPQLFSAEQAQIGVVSLDLRQWLDVNPQAAAAPYLAELSRSNAPPRAGRGALRATVEAAPIGQRQRVLSSLLIDQLAELLRSDPAGLNPRAPLEELGLDSLMGLELRNKLEHGLDLKLLPTIVWSHPTLADLGEQLLKDLELEETAPASKRELSPVAPLRAPLPTTEPIAIIGLGCRFPGGRGPEEFWQTLVRGEDRVTEVPPGRWSRSTNTQGAGELLRAERWGAFLDGVDEFDAAFFGISPREAAALDPQQRVLLEVLWEALEHAGLVASTLANRDAGVFVGISNHDYEWVLGSADLEEAGGYAATGNANAFAAGRLSYVLGLQGPSLSVDTACSSSLVAIHLACQSLRDGESELALAAGCSLMLSPLTTRMIAQTQALSSDGACKTFDTLANGYVRGEGCGVIVLKRQSVAEQDGDRILALIRGSAVNQDGRSTGLTAPNVRAQQALLRRAYANAGVDAGRVGLIEAHGTGTSLGDPIEVEALKGVVGETRSGGEHCALGSVKTNIGHLEAAAGVAGLIKAVLALRSSTIPRHLHFRTLNSRIDLGGTPFVIPTETMAWPRSDTPRIAGVSSFGMSGTNAHIVLEEAPTPPPTDGAALEPTANILLVSGKTESALSAQAARYADWLDDCEESLGDLCHTAATGREHFVHRLAVVSATKAGLREGLQRFQAGESHAACVVGNSSASASKLAFLFTGQGAQYLGMGQQLYETQPVFREALSRCSALLQDELERPLLSVMFGELGIGRASDLDETMYTQPCLFALEYALAELWRCWGVEPEVVLGHSLGEYVAACVAGVFSLEDGLKLASASGRLMQGLARDAGVMVAVAASREHVSQVLERYSGSVVIAAENSPTRVVISGQRGAVQQLCAEWSAAGVQSKALNVSHAFHSPLTQPILDEFEAVAQRVEFSAPRIPLVSSLTGALAGRELLEASYWRRHLREPVRFETGVRTLQTQGCNVYLELGPQPTLLGLGQRCGSTGSASWLPSLRRGRGDWHVILESLGELHVQGVPIDWSSFDAPYTRQRTNLPTYAWQRRRHWAIPRATLQVPTQISAASAHHPLLGLRLNVSDDASKSLWQATLSPSGPAYLDDHRIDGVVVVPGAAYVEMALSAGGEVFGSAPIVLADIAFHEPLAFPGGASRAIQFVLIRESTEQASFRVSSLPAQTADQGPSATWIRHATGTLRSRPQQEFAAGASLDAARRENQDVLDRDAFYAQWRARGLEYGPFFEGVRELWGGAQEALGLIRLPADDAAYRVHPGLLDACFQLVGAAAAQTAAEATQHAMIPVAIGEVRLWGRISGEIYAHARLRSVSVEAVEADLRLFAPDGTLVAELSEFRAQRVRRGADARDAGRQLYLSSVWRPASSPPASSAEPGAWLIVSTKTALAGQVRSELERLGAQVVCVSLEDEAREREAENPRGGTGTPESCAAVLDAVFSADRPGRGVLLLAGATPPADADSPVMDAVRDCCRPALHLVQALTRERQVRPPRLWLVTEGARQVLPGDTVAAADAALWGLGATTSYEHPELRCSRVDLAAGAADGQVAALVRELLADDSEDRVAIRGADRYVERLEQRAPRPMPNVFAPAGAGAFRLETDEPGRLDRLVLRAAERRPPGPGEVEIAVSAAGLNFRDVLMAMGLYPEPIPLGGECAGRIVALGAGVQGLEVGQEVVAFAEHSFGAYTTGPAAYVHPLPSGLSLQQGAAIPTVYLTAWLALYDVAHLQRGERILIHSAAGGTGLAAVQLAQRVGAEVYATAGSDEKRNFLRGLGVERVMDSRSLSFGKRIIAATRGAGVDVVLNSLPGKAIGVGLSCLGSDGRFLELGKRDIYEGGSLDLKAFRRRITYSAIDLAGLALERPARFSKLFQDVMAAFDEGRLEAPPVGSTPVARVEDAFRTMAQGKHIGKLVVALGDPEVPIAQQRVRIRSDGTYLLTGGLGGLGLSLASWLVEQGARSLMFVSRRGVHSEAQQRALNQLEKAGARVQTAAIDVSDERALARLLGTLRQEHGPLRGVFHLAGVLDDGVLREQRWERFATVLGPKVGGAWALHRLTREDPLDLFVLYSSAASLLGSPGQGNYAAANAFLDALARQRREEGLPGLSINWGPFREVGMAAELASRRGGSLWARAGIDSLSPAEGQAALKDLLDCEESQAGVIPLDVDRWLESNPHSAASPYLSELVRGHAARRQRSEEAPLRASLLAATAGERIPIVKGALITELARVLRSAPEEIDSSVAFTELGLDSLVGMDFLNALEDQLGITLSETTPWTYPTIDALVPHLLELVDQDAAEEVAPADSLLPAEAPRGSKEDVRVS